LSMATCALIYLVARRVIPTTNAVPAVVAALLYAVSPWFNVIGSVTSLGFYAAGQLTAISAIYCALRLADADTARDRAGWAFLVGFASGLAVWTTVASIYVLVPIVFWVGASLRSSWSRFGWAIGGALLGGLPLWVWFVQNRALPIPPKAVESSSIPQRLGNLFGPVLRQYVGVTYAHADGGLPLALQIVIVAVLLAALVAVMLQRRHGLLNVLRLRPDGRRPMDLLLAVPIVVVIAYAVSDSTWYTGTPRYLLITNPLFAIGLAALLARLRATPAAIAGGVLVVLMAALSGGFFRGQSANPTVAERDRVMGQVTRFLVAEHETYVYGDYWTAIPLQYVAGSRLEVAVCVGSKRFADTQRAVAAHDSPVYVSSPLDGSGDPIGHALATHNVAYRKTTIGTVTIYDHITGNVQPSAIGLQP
jgi:hypothetical protein